MKKIMAIITSMIILAASVLPAQAVFTDVDDTNPYKTAITTLSCMGVIDGYEDGSFRPDGAITRAEFTKLIVFMLSLQDIKYSTYTFGDVDPNHWAANFIQTGYDRGIIAGFEDGTFRAEEPVTYEQALKMVVCTLGYEQFALNLPTVTDSWSERYVQQANELKLTDGVKNQVLYEGASRGVVAQILYNALEVNMYENNGYNWVETDKNLMKDYLKVKELKGTLVGVGDYKTEDCTVSLPENHLDIKSSSTGEEVLIDYSSFTQNITDVNKYLGNKIKVFYRQPTENDERVLLSIDDETTKNTVTEIDYSDLNGLSGNSLKYYDGSSKTKTARLKEDDLTVIYNGKLVGADETVDLYDPYTQSSDSFTRQEALEEWMNPDSPYAIYGSVTLTDNSNDGTVDMIQINDYEVIVAYAAPNTTDYRITDKLITGNYIILDPQSPNYTYTITKDGVQIPITSIAANDIVLYAWSLDQSICTVLVSNKSVTGTVSSMTSDGSRMTISGTNYDVGPRCASYILEKNNKDLKVGVSGTFYIDSFNTAIYGTLQEAATSPYAYIADAYLDYDEGGKAYITAYAPNSNASAAGSYPLKDNVKINGSSVKAEAAIDRIQSAASYTSDESEFAEKIYGAGKKPLNTTYAQPARLTISNNQVTDIVLLTSDDIMPQNEDKEKIVKCKELDEYTYSSNSFKLGTQTAFSVNSNTTVIYVPADRKQKKQYAKKNVSSTFISGDNYYVEAYDLNSSKIAGLIILYQNDGTLTTVKKDTDFSVVSSLPETVYSDVRDATVQSFEVFSGASSTPKKWTTYNETEFSDVEVGDVIQFAFDSDNLIQGRINNIKFSDIAAVLDNNGRSDDLYSWDAKQTPSAENNYQEYVFDYRFKKSGTSEDEIYSSSTLGNVPYSRAAMFNISQVIQDESKIYVTQSGFDIIDDMPVLDDEAYEEYAINSGTKILRMEDKRDEISPYVADTTTPLSISDLKDAKNYGLDCSKVLILSSKGIAKLIVIYK